MSVFSAAFLALRQHFESIEGWCMVEAAAIWDCILSFQKQSRISGDLFEIGVYCGKTAVILYHHLDVDSETLYLVDRYLKDTVVHQNLLQRRPGAPLGCEMIQVDSRVLADHPKIREVSNCRWFHIDGCHTGTAVLNDLAIADKVLSDTGIIVLDDFFNPLYPQLTVDSLGYLDAHGSDLSLFLLGCNKAYVCRPSMAKVYKEYCYEHLIDDLEERDVRLMLARTDETDCLSIVQRFEPGRKHRGPDEDPDNLTI